MSESLHIGPHSDDEPIAEVLRPDFTGRSTSSESIKPNELSDKDIVDQFLSQFSHPSAYRQSSELGEYIQDVLGSRNASSITETDVAWRARIRGLMINVDDLHDDELDQLLNIDEVLKELYDTLKSTRDRAKELREERKALLLLRELRAGVTLGNIDTSEYDNQRWHSLVRRLAK